MSGFAVAVAVAAAVAVTGALAAAGPGTGALAGGSGDDWTDFWRPFVLSPGAAAAAAVIAATIAFLAAGRTTKAVRETARDDQNQRELANRREQWWKATMWAADHSTSPLGQEATLGFRALEALQTSPASHIDAEQIVFIKALTDDVIAEVGLLSPAGESEPMRRTMREQSMREQRTKTEAEQLRYPPSVYVSAAKTRVTSDKLLGLESPPKLIRLADGDTSVLPRQNDVHAEDEPEPRHAEATD